MTHRTHGWSPAALLAPVLIVGCASSPPPAPAAPPPAEPATEVVVEQVAPEPEPSPEDKARAEALAGLEQERTEMRAQHAAAVARMTPELREQARVLASTSFPTPKAALKAAQAGSHRSPEHVARDASRHPVETLEFLGFKPTLTVLEYGPGEGWYTEILAPALATRGKLLASNTDPNGPADQRSSFYGERFKLFLETSPELYGKVETVMVDSKAPHLDLINNVDMVLLFRTLHGMVNAGTLEAWLSEFHKALKPGGVLGIEQHRAKPDAVVEESSKLGYLPEKWLIKQIEAQGFKLVGKSEINANPKDTKDYPKGVWTLPPSLDLGDQDRAKYEAIGESDRMTLKFVKVKR
jgi:predicted methyltransferase